MFVSWIELSWQLIIWGQWMFIQLSGCGLQQTLITIMMKFYTISWLTTWLMHSVLHDTAVYRTFLEETHFFCAATFIEKTYKQRNLISIYSQNRQIMLHVVWFPLIVYSDCNQTIWLSDSNKLVSPNAPTLTTTVISQVANNSHHHYYGQVGLRWSPAARPIVAIE